MLKGCIQGNKLHCIKRNQVAVKPKLQFAKPGLPFNKSVVFYFQTTTNAIKNNTAGVPFVCLVYFKLTKPYPICKRNSY